MSLNLLGKKALLVCLELFSIHGRSGIYDFAYLMRRALLGDGCAAVVLSGEDLGDDNGKWAVLGNSSYLVENSTHISKIFSNDEGLDMETSPELPKYIESRLGPFVDKLLKEQNFSHHSEIDLIGIHPASPVLLKAAQSGLALSPEKLKASWDTLKNYGNMSSGTIWFVIEKLLQTEDQEPKTLMALTYGPGVTIEGVVLSNCSGKV